jgi:GH15 family glucan-1,4-alpha-glucosidase
MEFRGGARKFLHSRLMCWVAFDRAVRLAQKRSLDAPVEDWLHTRAAVRQDIFTNLEALLGDRSSDRSCNSSVHGAVGG